MHEVNFVVKRVCEDATASVVADVYDAAREAIGSEIDSFAVRLDADRGVELRCYVDDNGIAKSLPRNVRDPLKRSRWLHGTIAFGVSTLLEGDDLPFDKDFRGMVDAYCTDDAKANKIDPIGDLRAELTAQGHNAVALVPLPRILLEHRITYGTRAVVYPPDEVDVDEFDIDFTPTELWAEMERTREGPLEWGKAAATQIDRADLAGLPIAALTMHVDWVRVADGEHAYHKRLISDVAETLDVWLDLVRFTKCRRGLPDTLPGRPGFLDQNQPFSTMVLLNPDRERGFMLAGGVETHAIVGGLGLDHDGPEHYDEICTGEVGNIARRALSMYSRFLEASRPTEQFISGVVLLEFIAFPDEFKQSDKVKTRIATLVARDRSHYNSVSARLRALITGDQINSPSQPTAGLEKVREKLVHHGQRLEAVVPDDVQRRDVLDDIDRFIGISIQRLIDHATDSWSDFEDWQRRRRSELGII